MNEQYIDIDGTSTKFEKWRGAVINIRQQGIDNMREEEDVEYICCMVTQMRVNTQVIHGYSNIVSNLGVIFGNVVEKNVPIELTLEFPTVIDANRYTNALFEYIMAAVSILRGYSIDIMFGPYALYFSLISASVINYYPGVQGAVARITVIGYDYYHNLTPLRDGKDWNFWRTTLEYLDEEYLDTKGTITSPSLGIILQDQISIQSLTIANQENINIIGKDSEYTVYPPYPTQVSVNLIIPLDPQAQNSVTSFADMLGEADVANNVMENNESLAEGEISGTLNNIDDIFMQITGHVTNRLTLIIGPSAYGSLEILPTAVTTSREQFMQGQLGLSGILVSYTPGWLETMTEVGIDQRLTAE